jgi:D-glycero-alpha-D-manno-heptose 1-phosphate guanylyltransferase
MAEVAGKPFLSYLFDYLQKNDFDHVILALGYKSEIVLQWLEGVIYPFSVSYVIEEDPLGTGGAIKLAFGKVQGDKSFVFNGDTFFEIDTDNLLEFHKKKNAVISLALKPMLDFDRYGSVDLDEEQRIIRFNEKQHCKKGLINGGVYIINKELFTRLDLPEKFSFEKDILEAHLLDILVYGCQQDRYFIDIGIPSDFEKANQEFKNRYFDD